MYVMRFLYVSKKKDVFVSEFIDSLFISKIELGFI